MYDELCITINDRVDASTGVSVDLNTINLMLGPDPGPYSVLKLKRVGPWHWFMHVTCPYLPPPSLTWADGLAE